MNPEKGIKTMIIFRREKLIDTMFESESIMK